MKMTHIITIPKDTITRYKFEKLQLALAVLEEHDNKNGLGIATDSSGDFYEFWLMEENALRRAEQMKYFCIGFLNMPELENL